MRKKLTTTDVQALQPRPHEDGKDRSYRVWDSEVPGLCVQVRSSGTRRWQVVYRDDAGRKVTYTVGDADLMPPGTARRRARRAAQQDAQGQRRAARAQARVDAEARRTAVTRTLRAYLERYRAEHLAHRRDGDATYRRVLTVWSGLLDHELPSLTRADVRAEFNRVRVRKGKTIAPGTLKRDLGALRAMLAHAVEDELIDAVPVPRFERLHAEPPNRRVRFLGQHDLHERDRFMTALEDPATPTYLQVMVKLALVTGLRRQELFTLSWGSVSFTGAQLTVSSSSSKTGKPRTVPLTDTAVQLLEDWRSTLYGTAAPMPATLVFESPRGGALTTVKTAWRSLCRRAAVEDFHLHDLRHCFATDLRARGVSLQDLAVLLGHGTVSTTERYAHITLARLRGAVDKLAD